MSFEMVKACVFCRALVSDPKAEKTLVWSCFLILTSGPTHTYPEIFVSANFFMRIHLASTCVCHIRSVYLEISVYALQSGNFCIRCVPGYVWKLILLYIFVYAAVTVSEPVFFRARFFKMLCWLILWDVQIRIGYVWWSYTIRIRYVWTQIFFYPHKKICGYKNLRIRVDGASVWCAVL